jgi:hypothetical protein
MRKSTVLLVLVSIVCALTAGCMPNAEGPVAFVPRMDTFVLSAPMTPPTTPQPSSYAENNVQR